MGDRVIDNLKKKYRNKKVLIVGLGLQGGGEGAARFFAELGAIVTVTDKKPKEKLLQSNIRLSDLPITFRLGEHRLSDFIEADFIIKGPSVLWSIPEIVAAIKSNIPVEMEVSFFAKHFPGKIIGVTGTRGKSTTTQMIFNILKFSGMPVFLGGGLPGISTISYLKSLSEKDWVVLELSSWSLSGFHRDKISPHIAVLTNLYPDHLNYYKGMDDYFYDKKAAYLYQKKEDYLIVSNYVNDLINEELNSKKITFSKSDFPYKLNFLSGDHNIENAAASLKVADVLKINKEVAVNIIQNFKGLPFRQQTIREVDKITFVNDTTSSTPIATVRAIESFSDKKIILILGGNSKNLPIGNLIDKLTDVEKIIFLAGSFTDRFKNEIIIKHPTKAKDKVFDDLKDAVIEAVKLAKTIQSKTENEKKSVIILFSPGATSFSMFDNEFQRGDEFNKIVKTL